MAQSRSASAVEAAVGTVVSFVLGVAVNLLVLPLMGYPIRVEQSVLLVLVFTGISLARSYIIRRIFAGVERRAQGRGTSRITDTSPSE